MKIIIIIIVIIINLEIDECLENISGCNQFCVNTKGKYYCSCYNGFEIDVDQHTCYGEVAV